MQSRTRIDRLLREMIDQIGQSPGQDLQGYSVSAQGPREAELTDPTGVTEASSSSSIEGTWSKTH